jgi:hypothetical protein
VRGHWTSDSGDPPPGFAEDNPELTHDFARIGLNCPPQP